MEPITLRRDGQRPLEFEGELIADSDGKWIGGKDQNRWYEIDVYRAADGRVVVQWHYHTQWQGESDHYSVGIYPTTEEAVSALEAFDPCAWVQGYRAIIARRAGYDSARDYESRQASLEASIRERYAAQVAEIAEALEVSESLPPPQPPPAWEVRYEAAQAELVLLGPGACEIVLRDFDPAKVERGPGLDPEVIGTLEQLRWAYPVLEPVSEADPGLTLELISTRNTEDLSRPGLHVLHLGPVSWHLDPGTALALHAIPSLAPTQSQVLLAWAERRR